MNDLGIGNPDGAGATSPAGSPNAPDSIKFLQGTSGKSNSLLWTEPWTIGDGYADPTDLAPLCRAVEMALLPASAMHSIASGRAFKDVRVLWIAKRLS